MNRSAIGTGRAASCADVQQSEGIGGLSERLGNVSGAVVAHHPTALDALGVEPGSGPVE